MPRYFDVSRRTTTNSVFVRKGAVAPFLVLFLAGSCVIAALFLFSSGSNPHTTQPPKEPSIRNDSAKVGSVQIRKPFAPRVNTGLLDPHGQPVTIACNTCHGNWTANAELRLGQKPERFHQHLQGSHGNLACVSCHNGGDGYASLRLADGKSVAFSEVMQLCAQCHGPQYRDYQHGAHGGMTGYWDLSKGGRERNNCVDCHQPHSPRYPIVQPARGPKDRFLEGSGHE